jgi:aspartyl-tRNA(Asn)/glutamyl-tRNA(Gln) amidotransferase subunit C
MTIDDLRETAELAHLNLGDEELAAAFSSFEQMLGYFAAMQAADGDKDLFPHDDASSTPAGQNAGARIVFSGYFRTDDPGFSGTADNSSNNNPNGETSASDLLNNAGERDGRFLVIPNVL